jgi:hypothetical protein
MKKELLFVIVMAFTVLSMTACRVVPKEDYGEITKKTINVGPFTDIESDGYADIHYIPSDTYEVQVSAPQKLIDKMKIKVDDGTLCIDMNDDNNNVHITLFGSSTGRADDGVDVYVKAPTLKSVEMLGSGNFRCDSTFKAKNFSITTSGSGDVRMKTVECSGSLVVSTQGSGDVVMKDIKAADVSLTTSGSGDIVFNVAGALKASIATQGSGDISARVGNVPAIELNTSGSGDIVVDCDNCGAITGSSDGSGDVSVRGTAKSCNVQSSGSGDVVTTIHQ